MSMDDEQCPERQAERLDALAEKVRDPRDLSRGAGPLPEPKGVLSEEPWDTREWAEKTLAAFKARKRQTLSHLAARRAEECRACEAKIRETGRPPCSGSFPGQKLLAIGGRDSSGGEAFEVEECGTYEAWERVRDLKALGVLPGYERATFGRFRPETESQKKAVRALQHLVDRGQFELKPGIRLYGEGTGCGKTHLAHAAARAFAARGLSVKIHDVADLLNSLRAGYAQAGKFQETLNAARHADVLVLDDLGREKPTPWGVEQIVSILNTRQAPGRITIVTTNLLLPALEERLSSADGGNVAARRVCSRLAQLCAAVVVDGPDRRVAG